MSVAAEIRYSKLNREMHSTASKKSQLKGEVFSIVRLESKMASQMKWVRSARQECRKNSFLHNMISYQEKRPAVIKRRARYENAATDFNNSLSLSLFDQAAACQEYGQAFYEYIAYVSRDVTVGLGGDRLLEPILSGWEKLRD